MTPAALHKAVFATLGPRPGMAAREALLPLLQGGRRAALRYEWVLDWKAMTRVLGLPAVHLDDGEEWFVVRVD